MGNPRTTHAQDKAAQDQIAEDEKQIAADQKKMDADSKKAVTDRQTAVKTTADANAADALETPVDPKAVLEAFKAKQEADRQTAAAKASADPASNQTDILEAKRIAALQKPAAEKLAAELKAAEAKKAGQK